MPSQWDIFARGMHMLKQFWLRKTIHPEHIYFVFNIVFVEETI